MGAKSVIFNLITKYDGAGAQKAAKGIDALNKKLNSALKEQGKKAALAGGAAAGGAFVAGLTGMIQLDDSRAKLEAQLGLTKDQSKKVGSVAGKLYASAYGESMDDVNAAVTSVIQNMNGMKDASGDALQQTTARAMDVAAVMGEDVGPVTAAVAQMLKTGLAKNAQEAFDILVTGTQKGANKAQDLLDTFNEYGTQFRKLGLDGSTAMGLIQQGLQGGARDADIVADALKEFSIRAVDGSDSTIAGFKDLGLNATAMAQQIAAGGPQAAKGLDVVLDRIRAMKDPVKQGQVATQLFGTQWEDMGAAFLKMDPTTAVQALGQVSGAADKAGAALGGTAKARFTAFTRTLQQDVMVTMGNVIGWFSKHTTAAKALGVGVGVLVAAYVTYNTVAGIMAARTALMTEGTVANTIVTKGAAIATKGWAIATRLLNLAFVSSPIGWIALALGLVVVGVIYAWKHFEGFRNAVMACWNGIKMATAAAWPFLQAVFRAVVGFIAGSVVPMFRLVWSVARMAWAGIMAAIRIAWAVIQPVFRAIAAVLGGVLRIAFTVFMNAVKIVWIAIQIYIKVAWLAIRGYFMAIRAVITGVLAPIFRWLYGSVIKPVWNLIRQGIATNWAAIKATFNAIRSVLAGPLSSAFRVFKSVVSTIWSGLRATISAVWNGGIKPVFNALKTAVGAVRSAFGVAVNGIRTIWDRLKNIAKAPVNFVIGLYNNGIVKLVNGIAGLVGIGTRLSPIKSFATGGIMPGYAPGRDTLMAAVSPGEAILRPEFTRGAGTGWVNAANSVARRSGPAGVRSWLAESNDRMGGEGLAFSRGGVVPGYAGAFGLGGIVSGWVKKAKDWTLGPIEKAARSILDKVLGGAIPGSGMFHDLIAGVPKWVKDHLFGWLKDKAAGGGPGMQAALAFAKSQSGKPYLWGGVGPGGYDCCLTGETRVFGPNGATPIRDVRAGDRVFAHVDGKLETHTVTAAWQSKYQPVFAVRTRNRTVTASANHPFLRVVMLEQSTHVRGGRPGEQIPARYGVAWARLDELERGDLLVQPRAMATEAKPDPRLPDGTPVDLEVAWLLGAIVGDGTVTDKGLRLCLYGQDRARATATLEQRWTSKATPGDSFGLIFSNVRLARALTDLEMRRPGPDKRIPEAVWAWDTDLQRAFLEGYCDADGHRPADQPKHGERTYSSASPELIQDARALHIMLGDAVSNISVNARTKPIIIKGKAVKNARALHTFTVWGRDGRGEAVLRRRPGLAAWLDAGDFTLAAVLEVESRGEQDTWDLEVDGAHNFVADGVVVHNSGFMSALTNIIHGKSPYSRLFTTHSFGASAPSGFVKGVRSGFEVGVTDAGVGHMAGTLLGVNVESSGSAGVHYGPGARGAHNGLFPRQYGLKADTGALSLRPGWNPAVYNGTGRVEYLETPRRGGGDEYHFHFAGPVGSQAEMERWLAASMERLRRRGKLPAAT